MGTKYNAAHKDNILNIFKAKILAKKFGLDYEILQEINATYEYAFDGIAKVLLCKGHSTGRENGRAGDPVMQSKYPAINLDGIEVGKSANLIPQIEATIVHHLV